jgi:hypothetical protein
LVVVVIVVVVVVVGVVGVVVVVAFVNTRVFISHEGDILRSITLLVRQPQVCAFTTTSGEDSSDL